MPRVAPLPEPLRRAVAHEFAGEAVLWAAPPSQARVFWPAMGIWLFAVPWTAFSLVWESVAVAAWLARPGQNLGGAPPLVTGVFVLFGLPFVLIGLGMLASPFWAAWKARRTVYALSQKRLAIIVAGRTTQTTSIAASDIAEIRRRERSDGSGDIEIVTGWRRDSDGDRVDMSHKLVGVPDARRLDDILRSLRERSARG